METAAILSSCRSHNDRKLTISNTVKEDAVNDIRTEQIEAPMKVLLYNDANSPMLSSSVISEPEKHQYLC